MSQHKRLIGLDLGSRRTKAILLENGCLQDRAIFEAWSLDKENITAWVGQRNPDGVGATGYSRRLAAAAFQGHVITEIKAFSLGVFHRFPQTRTIIDIGGQDAKTIRLEDGGQASDFEMNDRCAAGTGKFFEIAAKTLGLALSKMADEALASPETVPVNSTCAVFAESEIIGKLADGFPPAAIARGIYRAVAERLFAMLNRIGHQEPILLVGGGANVCLAHELHQFLQCPVQLPEDGVYFGALGVAIHAGKEMEKS